MVRHSGRSRNPDLIGSWIPDRPRLKAGVVRNDVLIVGHCSGERGTISKEAMEETKKAPKKTEFSSEPSTKSLLGVSSMKFHQKVRVKLFGQVA